MIRPPLNIVDAKKRNLWIMFVCNLIHGLGMSIFGAVYQPFLFEITQSESLMGIIVSLGTLSQTLPLQLTGKMSDRFGRKIMISLGLIICVIGLLPFIIAPSLFLVILGGIAFYLGVGLWDPSWQTFVTENSNKSQGGLIYGLMFFAYFGGSIGGNSIIVALGSSKPSSFFFQIFLIILLLEWIIQFLFLTEKFHHKSKAQNNTLDHLDKTTNRQTNIWKSIFKNKQTRIALIFFTMDAFIWGISISIYNGGLVSNQNITLDQLAFILLIFNISNMVFQIPAGKLVDKWGKRKALIISEVAGMIYFILSGVAWAIPNNAVTILIFAHIIFGVTVAFFIPAQFTVTTNLDEKHRAEAYGMIGLVKGLGFMPTGVIGGFLIEKIHYLTPFLITTILIPVEIWFLLKFFPKDAQKKKNESLNEV